MKLLAICLFIFMPIVMTGCVTPPKSPDELRSAVNGGMVAGSRSEVFTVNRPFSPVVDNMKRKWTTCLAQTIKIVTYTTNNGMAQNYEDKYRFNPSVSQKGEHAELLLQQQRLGRQAIMTGGKLPDKGFYAVLVDIDSVNGHSTRINMQELPMTGISFEGVMKSAKSWAEGGNADCPDLSK